MDELKISAAIEPVATGGIADLATTIARKIVAYLNSTLNEIRINLQKQSTLYVQALYLLLQAKFDYLLHHINR